MELRDTLLAGFAVGIATNQEDVDVVCVVDLSTSAITSMDADAARLLADRLMRAAGEIDPNEDLDEDVLVKKTTDISSLVKT